MTTPIPPGIASPDEVETRLGMLHFSDGGPDKATTETLNDKKWPFLVNRIEREVQFRHPNWRLAASKSLARNLVTHPVTNQSARLGLPACPRAQRKLHPPLPQLREPRRTPWGIGDPRGGSSFTQTCSAAAAAEICMKMDSPGLLLHGSCGGLMPASVKWRDQSLSCEDWAQIAGRSATAIAVWCEGGAAQHLVVLRCCWPQWRI